MINYKDIKIGDKQINTVYLGDKLIFQKYDISTLNVLEYAVEMGYQKSSKIYIDAMDSFIRQMKQDGNFQKCDVLYWMQGDGDAFFRCINLVNPELSGTPYGGLILTNQGIEGNGIDGYIDTNFNPAIGVNKYKLNDAGRASYVISNNGSGNGEIIDGVTGYENTFRASNSIIMRINDSGSNINIAADLRGIGFKAINRVSELDVILYNEDQEYIRESTSTTVLSLSQRVYRLRDAYSLLNLSTYSMGSAITGQDAINHRQAIINNLI